MSMETADSTQLVKCRVTNQSQDESFRLIERSNFDLWRYLVVNNHHITVSQPTLCLWAQMQENNIIFKRIYSKINVCSF